MAQGSSSASMSSWREIAASEDTDNSHFFPKGLPDRKKSRAHSKEPGKESDEWFWGLGQATASVEREIELASRHSIHIVIIGETGTGKEFVARKLHSTRQKKLCAVDADSPFVAINCGAIPEALAESILFGHERGAFTSARERQYGKFELSKRGSLFLDEIQTLALPTQVKLLRVLQTGEIERLGGRTATKVECQIVAATNVPLELLVERQLFRRDLYYRLNICPIYLPALRHRKEDLPVLIKGLLQKIRLRYKVIAADLSPNAFESFLNYSWPGNIRELEHCLLYAAFRSGSVIEEDHLPGSLTGKLSTYLAEGQWA